MSIWQKFHAVAESNRAGHDAKMRLTSSNSLSLMPLFNTVLHWPHGNGNRATGTFSAVLWCDWPNRSF